MEYDASLDLEYWNAHIDCKNHIDAEGRPELPTEISTVLHGVEVEGDEGVHTAMLFAPAFDGDAVTWMVSLAGRSCHWVRPDRILSWTLATAPDGTQTPGPAAKPRDVMDEDDHRDRLATWHSGGSGIYGWRDEIHCHGHWAVAGDTRGHHTLKHLADFATITFADDEVQ